MTDLPPGERHHSPRKATARGVIILIPLFVLLVFSLWFAARTWVHLGGDPIPAYGYVAMAGAFCSRC